MNFIEIFGRMSDRLTKRPILVDPDGRIIVSGVWEEYFNPFGKGPLTSDGNQTSATLTQAAATNTNEVVELVKINTALPGRIIGLFCALTGGFWAASSATADLIYQWQAKSISSSSWVNLHTAVTKTDINTTEIKETYSGRFATATNTDGLMPQDISTTPLQLRLLIQTNEASQGKARTYNSSLVIVQYIPY